jgi:hypothetical protein
MAFFAVAPTTMARPRIVALRNMLAMNEPALLSGSGSNPKLVRPGV